MPEEADRPVTLSDLLSFGTRLETSLEAKMDAQHAETRRHFDVMAEDLRSGLSKVINAVDATNDKLDRLITRNAIEHAAFVDAYPRPRSATARA